MPQDAEIWLDNRGHDRRFQALFVCGASIALFPLAALVGFIPVYVALLGITSGVVGTVLGMIISLFSTRRHYTRLRNEFLASLDREKREDTIALLEKIAKADRDAVSLSPKEITLINLLFDFDLVTFDLDAEPNEVGLIPLEERPTKNAKILLGTLRDEQRQAKARETKASRVGPRLRKSTLAG